MSTASSRYTPAVLPVDGEGRLAPLGRPPADAGSSERAGSPRMPCSLPR